MRKRLLAALLALLMTCCLGLSALAEETTFVEPTLAPDATPYDAEHPELLEDERAHYYALLENGQIVGNMFLYDWQGERDFLKIMNLGVAPDRRGQGLACRLLQKAAEELKASMLTRCCGETRESNLAMRRVFERCGYRLNKTEESYYENPTESACKYVLRREELEENQITPPGTANR